MVEFLCPTVEVIVTARIPGGGKPGSRRRIGILDDGLDPPLIERIEALLTERIPDLEVKRWSKSNGHAGSPPELIDRIASACDVVLVGVAL